MSDRVGEYAKVIRWTWGMTPLAKARACAALEDHYTAALLVDLKKAQETIAQLRKEVR